MPSAAEQKVMEFDANVSLINKVLFCIGEYFDGYETVTYTIDGDKVHTDIEYSLILKPSYIGDSEIEEMDKEYLVKALKDLHIGDDAHPYNFNRFF